MQSLDKKELQFEPISLEPLIESLVKGWQIRAANAGIKFRIKMDSPLPQIVADPDLLPHALANLLDNAIKFSPDGGPVTISSWKEKNNLLITVTDQGVGIAEEEFEEIFQRFHQVDGL